MYTDQEINPQSYTSSRKVRVPLIGVSLLELILMVGIVWGVRTYVFQLFRVNGPSMCPTMNMIEGECAGGPAEMVFVNQLSHQLGQELEFGEIVVFKSPVKDLYVIKRVMGVPGDTIDIQRGELYRSNKEMTREKIDEPFLSDANRDQTRTFGVQSFTVPEGHYFLLGDNRAQSLDGRHCYRSSYCQETGPNDMFIPRDQINGTAEFVLWPPENWRLIRNEYKQEDSPVSE